MLYSRFGSELELVRLATVEDVEPFENRKPDDEDRERSEAGYRAIAKFEDGKERLVDIAFLRADGGIQEIDEAFERLRAGGTGHGAAEK